MAITCYSHAKASILDSLPWQKPSTNPLKPSSLIFTGKSPLPINSFSLRRPSIVRVAIRIGETSGLDAPLEPSSLPGRSLGGVLQNDPDSFYEAVSSELNRLSDDRDDALARVNLSAGSPEACLHRRIAELKEEEYQPVVEDIMYMLIYRKFLESGTTLLPDLDKCLCNGRLDTPPSNLQELESIHSLEELELIREYLTLVLGRKAGSNVMVSRAPAKVERLQLREVYARSILYGYFLKSASFRHRLERYMSMSYLDVIPSNRWPFLFGSGFYGIKSIALGEFSAPRSTTLSQMQRPQEKPKPPPKLKLYVQGFDHYTLQECSKLSKVAMDVVEKHCLALFAIDDSSLLDENEPILTSLVALKRLVLEAIAFGCFVWDSEKYVDRVFKLDE